VALDGAPVRDRPRSRPRRMMYSPGLMDGEQGTDNIERLEERLAELERLAEGLESVSDSEVVGALDRAVALLEEINQRLEVGLLEAEGEVRELGDLLERVDFGPVDAALQDLEQPPGEPGGS
jgi:hypothetical protein